MDGQHEWNGFDMLTSTFQRRRHSSGQRLMWHRSVASLLTSIRHKDPEIIRQIRCILEQQRNLPRDLGLEGKRKRKDKTKQNEHEAPGMRKTDEINAPRQWLQ
jgi:hypothetical protein